MAAPIGFGESQGFPIMSYAHACVCVHTCVCLCAPPQTPIHPPLIPHGGPPESVKIQ